jgi:hypothetical protein
VIQQPQIGGPHTASHSSGATLAGERVGDDSCHHT